MNNKHTNAVQINNTSENSNISAIEQPKQRLTDEYAQSVKVDFMAVLERHMASILEDVA